MCLSHITIGLSQLTFLGEGKENNEHRKAWEENEVSVFHCDMSVTFILFSLDSSSTYSQFKEVLSRASLVVQWLRSACQCRGHDLIPELGRFHLLQSN